MDSLRQSDTQLCLRCREPSTALIVLRWNTEELWCQGCSEFHDPLFFSDRQRTRPSIEWMCIGRDGSVPLCQHKSVSWDDVSSLAAQQEEGTTTASASALNCLEPEHNLGSRRRTWCKVKAGDLAGSFDLHIVWMQAAFDLDPAVPIKCKHIHRFLLAQNNASATWGATFCPHVKPDDGRLLLPFDASRCVCFLDWTNNDAVAKVMMPPTHTHDDGRLCCRCEAQRRLSQRPAMMPKQPTFFSAEDGGFDERTWDLDTRHAYTCTQCAACYTWVREWGQGSRVYLRCHRRLLCQTTPTSKRWLKHINPASYLAKDDTDKERKELSLCDTPGCQRQARSGVLFPGGLKKPADDWLPLHLPALRHRRLREEAAREAVMWVENQVAHTVLLRKERPFSSGCILSEDVRAVGRAVALAAAQQPSPRMQDAARHIATALALDRATPHILQWMPVPPARVPVPALSWAAKEAQRVRRRASLDNRLRVFPALLDQSMGTKSRRFEVSTLLLAQEAARNRGEPVGDIDFRQLVPKVTSDHVYYVRIWRICYDMCARWQRQPAVTPLLEQKRKVARVLAIYAVQCPSEAALRALEMAEV